MIPSTSTQVNNYCSRIRLCVEFDCKITANYLTVNILYLISKRLEIVSVRHFFDCRRGADKINFDKFDCAGEKLDSKPGGDKESIKKEGGQSNSVQKLD